MSSLADRRARLRYDVVGVLRGTLELSEPAYVDNISREGALLQTTSPPRVGGTLSIQTTLDGRAMRVLSRIRHVTALARPATRLYSVGVEFISRTHVWTSSLADIVEEEHTEPDHRSGM